MPSQPTNQDNEVLLSVSTVNGIDGTTPPFLLSPDNVVTCSNFLPDQGYAALTTALGRANIPGIGPVQLPGPCNGVGTFHRFNPFRNTPDVYVFAVDYQGAGTLWYLPVDGSGPLTQLTIPSNLTLTAGQPTSFAEGGVWLFVTNGTDTPIKIDNTLTVTGWGIVAPSTAPTLTGTTGGYLSFGEAPYYYCVTFGHAKTSVTDPGLESSQGAIAGPITLSQTNGAGTVDFSSGISAVGVGSSWQFMLQIGSNAYPYGDPYVAIGGGADTNVRAATLMARYINSAPPLAYTQNGGGTLTVTATLDSTPGEFTISVSDSTGNIFGPGGPTLQYYVNYDHGGPPTYVTPDQTSPANVTGGSTQTAVTLTNIPLSTDSQVDERNIYRLGGALGQWRLVVTLNDNTTTTYTDTVSDKNLTGQALTVFRDPPPKFSFICSHQQRIFGFNTLNSPLGSPSASNNACSLWWSNYAEPWGFNGLQNVLTVGSALEGNPGMGLASLGTVLGVWKRREFYALYGNSDATWATGLFKIADVGCVSPRSICCAYGMAGWVAQQGAYIWNGAALPQNVSDGKPGRSNLRNVFNNADQTDLKSVVGFFYNRMLGLSFKSTKATYMYDPQTGWWPLPYWAVATTYDLEADNQVIGVDNNSNVYAWFTSGQDLGAALVATFTTRISGDPSLAYSKTLTALLVDAPNTPNTTFQYQVITDPGNNETVWPPYPPQYEIDLSQGLPRHRAELPVTQLVDIQLNGTLTTSTPGTIINRIELYGTRNRILAPEQQSDS